MIGQREIFGIAILAFLGSIVGLSMLGADIASTIGGGFVVAFFAGIGVAFSTVDRKTPSFIPRSQPYESAKFGTAASEIQQIRLGFVTKDVATMNKELEERLRG